MARAIGPGQGGAHRDEKARINAGDVNADATDRRDVPHNLFFALMPDEATRTRIGEAATALRVRDPGLGRWLDPRRYHVTLHFLGQHRPLPEALVERARAAAQQVRQPSFELVLDRTGGFSRARAGWLGCREPAGGLIALHAALRDALRGAGVAMDDSAPYTPHVTVLRNLRHRMPDLEIEPIRWRANEFVLVDSRHGDAVEYSVVGRWPLG